MASRLPDDSSQDTKTDMTHPIEEQIAHLQKTVDDLSDMVARQDADIRRLVQLVDHLALRERARGAEGGGGIILMDERPPHY